MNKAVPKLHHPPPMALTLAPLLLTCGIDKVRSSRAPRMHYPSPRQVDPVENDPLLSLIIVTGEVSEGKEDSERHPWLSKTDDKGAMLESWHWWWVMKLWYGFVHLCLCEKTWEKLPLSTNLFSLFSNVEALSSSSLQEEEEEEEEEEGRGMKLMLCSTCL